MFKKLKNAISVFVLSFAVMLVACFTLTPAKKVFAGGVQMNP